ncbi:MAG: bifunctional glutamate N-acetyltransferase/amino-acid acetyltransferase ArgJ [Desulfobacterales bacterium]|nr:bifunctional glutamate N-acetyltransferase/amino-acid acetyltransferase ArgJ [Desulfobacterales bacterium]
MGAAPCMGFKAAGVHAGLKKNGEPDLGLIFSETPAAVAAVFTRNQVQAAPVVLDRQRVASGQSRAIIVNSGNANCCTGEGGMRAAERMGAAAARALGLADEDVLVASTGVIGQPLPVEKIETAAPALAGQLSPEGFSQLARAIMTTDTEPKTVFRTGQVGERSYHIAAVAKGAGMIRPDMATMLCFICTDADLSRADLDRALRRAVDASFNRITIDGDTSTNDTVILMANGASGAGLHAAADREQFAALLEDALLELARWIVRDGEGVNKTVEIRVRGARTSDDALRVADTIAHSPLVKTAFFGQDANWGRILAAAGRAGVTLDPERLDLYFDDVQMVAGGVGCGPDAEARATAVLKLPAFAVTLELNRGTETARLLTCDFSLDYVKINADYRT